jgi:hypothetical protein
LERHFPEKATDPQWVMEVSKAIDYAHSRSRLACYHFGRPSNDDVRSQLGRVVDSSDELLEAFSGASTRRHQTSIANRLWYPLHSLWTLLYEPPEGGDVWQRTPNRPLELDQAFQLLRKLNQRSRRILRRIERTDSGKRSVRSGAKPDHYPARRMAGDAACAENGRRIAWRSNSLLHPGDSPRSRCFCSFAATVPIHHWNFPCWRRALPDRPALPSAQAAQPR